MVLFQHSKRPDHDAALCVDEHVLDAILSLSASRVCLAVSTVPAPPAVVWFAKCVSDQCSRSVAVATCSRFGPSA